MVPEMATADPATIRHQAVKIAKALNAVSAATHQPFSMADEGGRFRIQKTVYLLQRLGYAPAQRFGYNLYVRGPYSPDLTKCYYALGDDGITAADSAVDVPRETLRVVGEALAKPDGFLEGLTTLLDVNREIRHLPAALAHAKAIKPHLDESIWREVRRFIANEPRLTALT
jgi:hypothetical protein